MKEKIVVEIDGERHVLVEDMMENYPCEDCSLYEHYCEGHLCMALSERDCHFEKERWKPKAGDTVWRIAFDYHDMCFNCFDSCLESCQGIETLNAFRTKEDAQAVCDKLNAAVKPVIDAL